MAHTKDMILAAIEDSGLEVAFDIPATENSSESEGVGGTSEEKAAENRKLGVPAAPAMGGKLKWSQLHQEILEAWVRGEDDWESESVKELAERLRSDAAELRGMLEAHDSDKIQVERLDYLLRLERIRKRDFSWDQLESVALGKMVELVEGNKIKSVGEYLAIAGAANRATRRTGAPVMPGHLSQTNIYMGGNGEKEASLPGPGGIGTMRLSLSTKTVEQLSKGITIDARNEDKYSDSVEMLGGDDIKELNGMLDNES